MSSLTLRIKFGYGVGHILNDLCSAVWFSYLLLYFHHVLRFPNSLAGVVLLIGQVADALSTPFVGHEADRTDDLPFCANYGRRKTWHLVGTFCVILSFPFIFIGCLGCTSITSPWAQVLYFAPFVIVFQFGWACTQISHLAILPNLSADPHDRTELNAIRYGCTVASTITVYLITWVVLGLASSTSDSVLSPKDAMKFVVIVLIIVAIGSTFSFIFHIMVREKNDSYLYLQNENEDNSNAAVHHPMVWRDWLKEPQFYKVGLIYMATRLFCNLTQAYIPIYLEDTLILDEKSIAYIPLVMYMSGLTTTTIMKPLNRLAGRKVTYLIGCILGGIGVLWIYLGRGQFYLQYYIYVVAILLGSGASTMLVTILSISADMIGSNIETGAFVYGSLSFTDKLSNGLVVMMIQYFTPCLDCCFECKGYFRNVIGYACGGAILLGVFGIFTLINTKVGQKKFYRDSLTVPAPSGGNSLTHYIESLNDGSEVTHHEVDDEEKRINQSFRRNKDYSSLSQTEETGNLLMHRDSSGSEETSYVT